MTSNIASPVTASASPENSPVTFTSTTTTISPILLLAITTPYIPPAPSCANIFATTSKLTSYDWNNFTTTFLSIVYSDPSDPRFTACQPPGWDETISSSRFHFSPAVCPEQWTAYDVREAAIGVSATPTRTTTTATTRPAFPFPNGVQIHNAYHISWDATDTATLSPTPPNLVKYGCSPTLSVWVPGETVSSLPCSIENASGGGRNLALTLALGITLPIVFVALICTCICIHYRNKRKGSWRPKGQAGAASEPPIDAGIQLGDVKR
ncbi:hypothetical protein DL98DRAFT_586281 [Cadophora sp. DSE1049]|nr:hypothetical protein DL98DRAFT_586281 [Cadophora sp. DSE1049]